MSAAEDERADDIAYGKSLAALVHAGSPTTARGHRGLCPACRAKFIEGAPEILAVPFEEWSVSGITALSPGLHGRALDGYELLLKAYDRDYAAYKRDYPQCPHPDAPFIRERSTPAEAGASKVKERVLEVLAQKGPLSGGDIVANDIGLTKNNSAKIMAELVDDGLVTMTKFGTAKIYKLA